MTVLGFERTGTLAPGSDASRHSGRAGGRGLVGFGVCCAGLGAGLGACGFGCRSLCLLRPHSVAGDGCSSTLASAAGPPGIKSGRALGLSVLGFSGYYLLLVLAIRDAGRSAHADHWHDSHLGHAAGQARALLWRSLLPGLLLTVPVCADDGLRPRPRHSADAGGRTGAALALPVGHACWTAFAVLNSAWLKHHREVNVTDWTNWLGVGRAWRAGALWWALGSEPKVLLAQEDIAQAAMVCIATGVGSAWLATVLWNSASRRLSASLCGQLIVSETLFALLYAFVLAGEWPQYGSAAWPASCLCWASWRPSGPIGKVVAPTLVTACTMLPPEG